MCKMASRSCFYKCPHACIGLTLRRTHHRGALKDHKNCKVQDTSTTMDGTEEIRHVLCKSQTKHDSLRVSVFIFECVCVCVRACVRACMRACVRVSTCV